MKNLFFVLFVLCFILAGVNNYAQPTVALTSPGDKSTDVGLTPTLTWTVTGSNITATHVYLKDKDGNVFRDEDVLTALSFNVPSGILSNNLKYRWKVRATGDGGTTPTYDDFSFYTPMDNLVSPINGVTGLTLEPTFTWTDLDYETGYVLKISTAGTNQVAFDAGVIFTDDAIPAGATTVSYDETIAPVFPLTGNTMYYWQLYAKDGAVLVPSPIRHFTTYPVVNVNQYAPDNNGQVYLANVYFSYGIGTTTSGLKFKIQIKASQTTPDVTAWHTPPVIEATTPEIYKYFDLSGGTKYYWRVILLNNANQVLGYSGVRNFTTLGGAAVPIPSWPVEDGTVYTYTPTLYWYMESFAFDLTYDIQISTTPNDGGIIPAQTKVNITNSYYPLVTPLDPGTTYYWQVRSVYKRSTPLQAVSDWSVWTDGQFKTVAAPTAEAPNLSYPIEEVDVYTTAPTFYWWTGVAATGLKYELTYSTDPAFAGAVPVSNISTTYKQISGLTPGARYYWKVRSYLGTTYSGFSDVGIFDVVGGVANSYPVATWPVVEAGNIPVVYSTKPDLYWYLEGASLGITGYVVKWIEGANPPAGGWAAYNALQATINNPNTTTYKFTSALTNGTTYTWAVAAIGGAIYSEGQFTVFTSPAQGQPELNYPIDGEIVYSTTPTFSWYFNGNTSGIIGYKLEYTNSDVWAPGATTTVTLNTTATTYNVPAQNSLTQGAHYWWRVTARLSGGGFSNVSPVEDFHTAPGTGAPVQPIVGGPNNISVTTNTPMISWVIPSGNGDALTYELEYANNPSFVNSSVISNIANNYQLVNNLITNTSYFWRVRSKNPDGNLSYHSNLGMFRVIDGTTGVEGEESIPENYSLGQNYPNPFNPTTVISYQLPVSGFVTLKVFDVIGREVATLVNENIQAGSHSVTFNSYDLASGVYYYKLSAGDFVSVKKMILVK